MNGMDGGGGSGNCYKFLKREYLDCVRAAEGILRGGEGTDGRRDFGFSGEGFG